jgi:hypothetical protein
MIARQRIPEQAQFHPHTPGALALDTGARTHTPPKASGALAGARVRELVQELVGAVTRIDDLLCSVDAEIAYATHLIEGLSR